MGDSERLWIREPGAVVWHTANIAAGYDGGLLSIEHRIRDFRAGHQLLFDDAFFSWEWELARTMPAKLCAKCRRAEEATRGTIPEDR